MNRRTARNGAAPFASSGRSRKGEGLIWLCAAGLALGLAMTAGLLALVAWKGTQSFWPRRIALLEVGGAAAAAPEQLAGYVVQQRSRRSLEGERIREVQVYRGNRDVYGDAFRFIDADQFRVIGHPADLWLVERLEHGNAIARPHAWVDAAGTRTEASDPGFRELLDRQLDEAGELRGKLRRIERKQIGRINRELEELRLAAKAAGAAPPAGREAQLQADYERLAAEARAIRERLAAAKLLLETTDGRPLELAQGEILHVFEANAAGFAGRLGECLRRVWTFLSDEPREANTEGGVFPAIFGTVVMTLVMSLFVTPFGVIAAIYLREYAKQGHLVRAVRVSVNNLAGVPSIVFGVFGVAFFVYFVGGTLDEWLFADRLPTPTYGTGGILWASLTLALLTLPVVIVATEEAIAAVPRGVREAALACGASKWQTIRHVVLPASLPGILTGVILAMARGAGEVAPLMIVGVVKWAPSLPIDDVAPFIHPERKFMHLGFHIYDLGFQSPDSEAAKPMVFATTLLLILIVVLMNLAAIMIRNRLRRRYATSQF